MPFHARNCFYLRISATNVIPLYLYLDERHIEWMTDRTLQHVISDLRPLLPPKLKAEANAHLGPGGPANAKRATVDVQRGDHYQFAYFLRKADPHSVILKTRNFVMVPPAPKSKLADKQNQSKKRKGSAVEPTSTKRSRKGKEPRVRRSGAGSSSEPEELDDLSTSSDDDGVTVPNTQPRRSDRTKGKARTNYRVDSDGEPNDLPDAIDEDEPQNDATVDSPVAVKIEEPTGGLGDGSLPNEPPETGPASAIDLDDDDDEEKIKPVLKLHYKGFTIYGRGLCVVVEPYPPMRGSTRAPSLAPQRLPPRVSSVAPPNYEAAFGERASVPPLFLPDFERERSATPALTSTRRMTSPLYSFGEQDEEEEEGFGMMAFSQVLNSVSGEGKGGIDEDDEIDGSVFFGDADESRELS